MIEKYLKNKKKIHFNSLWLMIASLIVALSLVAVIIITVVISKNANQAINVSIEESNSVITQNVASSIDAYILNMINFADGINELIEDNDVDSLSQEIFSILREDIETLVIFGSDGSVVFANDYENLRDDITFESLFIGLSLQEDGYLISEPHVQRIYQNEYPWVITLTKSVTWRENGETMYGVIMIDMNFLTIQTLCTRNSENNGYLYIANENDDIVYHPNQQMIYAGIESDEIIFSTGIDSGSMIVEKDSGDLAVYVQPLSNVSWKIVGVVSCDGLSNYSSYIGSYVSLTIVVLTIFLVFGSIVISSTIVSPIYKLMDVMGEAWKDGEFPVASETGIYETSQLGRSFNSMVRRINSLLTQIKNEQAMLRKSELKTLTNQINPHFLYNTLESVVWLAEGGEQKNVIQMITALSKYFRLSLSGAREFITVFEEVSQIENYLIIEKMRFGDSFTYEISYDEEIKEAKTPKIMLQPIVENALVHGLSNMDDDGVIQISAKKDGDDVLFIVKDNGQGMKEEQVKNILIRNPKSKSGIGVKNVHQRVRLLYGNKYGVSVESELDEGTTVYIRLPIDFTKEDV